MNRVLATGTPESGGKYQLKTRPQFSLTSVAATPKMTAMNRNHLTYDFYHRNPKQVAQDLIGCRLVSRVGGRKTAGIIVETEAYLAVDDAACHGTRGRTKSNASMFGVAGIAYVYPIHAGFCFNVVTGELGKAEAVLIRAIQPTIGFATMKSRRQQIQEKLLTTGPSRLCTALAINRAHDGLALDRRRILWIEANDQGERPELMVTRRIGVTSAQDLQLRYVWRGNPFVSGPKSLRI